MPPPKRPFTTSSLTSTLKSTIASQPLLSNLTNIDKLSSQASSLAQKTAPFFNAINQQHQQQQQQSNTANQQHDASPSQATNSNQNNMIRANQSASAPNQQPPKAQMASTPTVDMSHLTEEERLMIQSVMAKAEMADMGMPVDTSAPSSTNLPSHTSQVLSQQTLQHQQQSRQQAILQQHQNNAINRSQQGFNQQQIPANSAQAMDMSVQARNNPDSFMVQQQQLQQQQQQQQQQQLQQQFQQQQQQQIQQSDNSMVSLMGPNQSLSNQNQLLQQTQSLSNNTFQNLQHPQLAQQQSSFNPETSRNNPLPSLEQQTQQLVSQINSQFNIGQNQQQLPNQQPNLNQAPTTGQHFMNQQQSNGLQQLTNLIGINEPPMNQMHNSMNVSQKQVSAPPQIQQQPQVLALNEQNRIQHLRANQAPQINSQEAIIVNQGQSNDLVLNSQQQAMGFATNFNSQQVNSNTSYKNPNNQFTILNSQSDPNRPNRINETGFAAQQQSDYQAAMNIHYQNPLTNQRLIASNSQVIFPEDVLNHQQLARDESFANVSYNSTSKNVQSNMQQASLFNEIDYNEQTLSDQEFRSRGSTRKAAYHVKRYDSADTVNTDGAGRQRIGLITEQNFDPRALQSHDLANKNSRHMKLRQLPNQPDRPTVHSSSDHPQGERSKSRENKHISTSAANINRRHLIEDSESQQESSQLNSGSEEEVLDTGKNPIAAKKASKSSSGKDKIPDKSEEALRLLSELKLTEQATQMMEQQQMLIKQSQELIKLQLEQQTLSQELKKNMKKSNTSDINAGSTDLQEKNESEATKSTKETESEKEKYENEDGSKSSVELKKGFEEPKKSTNDPDRQRNARLVDLHSKKSTSFCNDSDIEDSPKIASKVSVFSELSDGNHGVDNEIKKRVSDREKIVRKPQTVVSNSSAQTVPSPRYNRDLLQSPTDTTDSDMEPLNHSNIRRQQQKSIYPLNRGQKFIPRRREPTGLPPSPLPVAAAIQLHQMQQQHFKQAGSIKNNQNRINSFMRSRSVTSSPNHHLEQYNSGYMTDSQRIRSTSPDTLSEFGGQRRRKRLPEPPTNTVPLTPSMVRKMIQAQRAGASQGKLLTSVNAQSTLLTNTHRNITFERPSNTQNSSKTTKSHISIVGGSDANLLSHCKSNNQSSNTLTSNKLNDSHSSIERGNIGSTSNTSDLNKFLSSTYGNSILRNNVTDIKETPELDKLISNLDEYYGLDTINKRDTKSAHSLNQHYLSSEMHDQVTLPDLAPSSISKFQPRRLVNESSYLSRGHSGNVPSLIRCNSEGENSLTSRIANSTVYRPAAIGDDYKNYNRSVSASSNITDRFSNFVNLNSSKDQPHLTTIASPTVRFRNVRANSIEYGNANIPSTTKYEYSSSYNRPVKSFANQTGRDPLYRGETLDYLSSSNQFKIPYGSNHFTVPEPSYSSKHLQRYTSLDSSSSDLYKTEGFTRYDRSTNYPTNSSTGIRFPKNLNNDTIESRKKYPLNLRENRGGSFYNYGSPDLETSQYYRSRTNMSSLARSSQMNPSADFVEGVSGYNTSDSLINPSQLDYYDSNYSSHLRHNPTSNILNRNTSKFVPLTKDDIINKGPHFDSIGYRFRTENQNKYVAQARMPIQCLQSRYPNPYKRILLSKNPKDRLGHGIGVRIVGGQPMPSLYDKVNKCIVTSGAFVTEVFQNSNVQFGSEMQEGDQIIEWNGVNLCNRSNDEVQQILLSQFSDDEVEIVYLQQDKLHEAYGGIDSGVNNRDLDLVLSDSVGRDQFETFALMNKLGMQSPTRSRYANETPKGSIRRKISLSSLTHMWSRGDR